MKLTNPWVGYLDRGYKQIKASIIDKGKVKLAEITDWADTNILVVIITMFAGMMEQLHFYIDNNSRESHLSTARKFSSVAKLVRLLDYRIRAKLPASVDLYITYLNANGDPANITQQAVIPSGTVVRTSDGISFMTTRTTVVEPGQSFGKVAAKQLERVENVLLGITTALPNQSFVLPDNYAHDTLELYIDGEPWILRSSIARSGTTDKHFYVDISETGIPTIRLGNGVKGVIPEGNVDVVATYYATEGVLGNDVLPNSITELDSNLVLPTPATSLTVTNNLRPVAGSEVEDIEDVRINAPLSIRTLAGAVTEQDWIDLTLAADGVAKADVKYTGGPFVKVYISPNGGGIATQALLEDTRDYLDTVRVINRKPTVLPAGITPVVIEMTILTRFRADKIQAKLDVENALTERFSFDIQDINGRVAFSDVAAIVDNLDKVDTVEITGLYTLPYPHIDKGINNLSWERRTLLTSNETASWRLVYTGTNMRLYYNSAYIANVNINQVYTDPKNLISFKVLPGNYSAQDSWAFKTYPANKTIKLDDNSVPIVIGGQTTTIEIL
jgi:hypothetical protein